ncbi:MAG: CcoQ/FixQ family Cbb3-type cytochrome c oxidase assembly chaperone [Pseudomonadales bacterium]|nr:CcoQ/FixQ family Cbb3-type cytochrome c oxidase assembly chaperone [Pseudomonadales bacterium]MCP5182635.1 CcoQ/FixQ family Cbb3-type cytochrome c oxidase assembly chaperone [Pseudomonadales bacterium]
MTLAVLAVAIGFTGLVLWVYWPANREHFELQANLVFDNEKDVRDE